MPKRLTGQLKHVRRSEHVIYEQTFLFDYRGMEMNRASNNVSMAFNL
jgi:hypothetical protein